MAQLVVSAAGAGIGFLFGGPTGAQIGWAAGSLLGASLGPGVEGPRLADTKVQISSYGAALPVVYGGVRITGNVIWSTPLIEGSSESGGKGGPTITSYDYSVSCAVAICEGPITGLRRIWADAKLVYDVTDGVDLVAQAASQTFAEYFTFYTGSETQLPDPTIEATEGAGQVEAYRGTAYVVFTSLPLADYGNRIPSFSFELSTEPDVAAVENVLAPLVVGPWTVGTPAHSEATTRYRYPESTGADYDGNDLAGAISALQADYPWATEYIGYYTSTNGLLSTFNTGTDASTDLNDGFGAQYVYLCYNLEQPAIVDSTLGFGPGSSDLEWCTGVLTCYYNKPTDPVMSTFFPPGVGLASTGHHGIGRMFGPETAGATGSLFPYSLNAGDAVLGANCVSCPPVDGYFPVVKVIKHRVICVERVPSLPAQTCEIGDPSAIGIAQIPGLPTLCVASDGTISPNIVYTATSGTYKQLRALQANGTEVTAWPLGPVLAPADVNYSSATFWNAEAAAAGVTGTYGVNYPIVVTDIANGSNDSTQRNAGAAWLYDIVGDLCQRAGLEPASIDVAALTDLVDGYKVTRQMSARAALEPLRQAYYFDAVENAREVVFVKRGGASVAALTADDLGATESAEPAALVTTNRAQETELPAEVNVAYECRGADYQTGTQQAQRVVTGSQQVAGVELPIVMTDAKAAAVADVLIHDAWQGRSERTFSTTRQFTRLLPTDVVTVNDGEFTYAGRITSKVENGPVITWMLRDEAAATYSPNATGTATNGGGSAIRFDGPMRVELMDIPLLRDADDNAGFYAASTGYLSDFRGGRLFKNTDGANYVELQDMSVTAALGSCGSTLGNFAGGNIVDEVNTLTVTLNGGTLSTITRAQLLEKINTAVVGSEVLCFERAVLVSGSTYTLSGFLRGRVGTERHIATHTAGERFVLVSTATVYRVSQSVAQIGATTYKGVSYGGALADAAEQAFDNTGEGLMPLSPAHLNVAPVPAGGYAVSWVRRSRYSADWRDGVDAPLAETSERYLVTVLDGATEVESQTVTTNAATLADADYTSFTVQVRQISETIGAGHAASATIS